MEYIFFVVLAVSATTFDLSTSTVAEKSHVVDMMTNTLDEERGKTIQLFGATIPVSEQVPDVIDQLASQGNLRNHLADDFEKTKDRMTNLVVGTQPGQTSSAQGTLLSTMTEAGPREPKEVDHSVRGVKRKGKSRDKAPRLDAQRTVQTGQAVVEQPEVATYTLPDLIGIWRIDVSQLESRVEEFSNCKLPDKLQDQVRLMALGSLYFERQLPTQTNRLRRNVKRIRECVEKLDGALLEQLGVDREKVQQLALHMYRNEHAIPAVPQVVYMAIGKELYRSLHSSA